MSNKSALNSNSIGTEGRHLDTLSSTNDFLKDLISKQEIDHGYYVSTEYQTSGRGQVGNTWLSDAGQNLLLSVLIRPESLSLQRYFHLNMSVCLAIVDMLNELHQGFLIKWPNDILFDGKKVAGILIENSISSNYLRQAIVGMGININQRDWPSELDIPAISLRQILGRRIDLQYIKELLFAKMNQRYAQLLAQPGAIRDQFHQYLYGFHQEVPAMVKDQRGFLKIREVAADGTLHALWQGRPRKFQFKEVKFLPG